jgi:hypothetical protein
MKQFKKTILLAMLISPLWGVGGHAQTVVQDGANNGQLKRMVYLQWNDWQPNPTTTWLGIPKNLGGWLFWAVLNNSYYKGKDLRPFKVGGQFDQDYAALLLQQDIDKKIKDTTGAMLKIWLSTDISMTGGALDVPYYAYFQDKYASLNKDITDGLNLLNQTSPQLYNEMYNSKWGQDYINTLSVINERINTNHSIYEDRGKRMVNYFNILNDLQTLHDKIVGYIYAWYNIAKLPNPPSFNNTNKTEPVLNNDQQIVEQILKQWKAK